jgi:quinol monooxygenase YgiN
LEVTIKAIIELQAKPGKRDEVLKAIQAVHESRRNAPGFIGYSSYEVIDNPDSLIEIAEWETAEARQAWLEKSMETGALNHLVGTLGIPFKAITIRELK